MPNFPSLLAQDSSGNLAAGMSGQLFALTDTAATTPLPVTDLSGIAFPGDTLTASSLGILPPFQIIGHSVVAWVSGTYRMDIPCIDQVPGGGSQGQILAKASGANQDLVWINVPSVPAGGGIGQFLSKTGAADFEAGWVNAPSGGGTVTANDVDTISGDLVNSGEGALAGALDIRYKRVGPLAVADLPAGSSLIVRKTGSTWPARPTNRTDVVVTWVGADPDPAIVASGTGGAINNVDIRMVV